MEIHVHIHDGRTNFGEKIMAKMEEVLQNLQDIKEVIGTADQAYVDLKAKVAELVAQAAIDQEAKDALQAQIDEAWTATEEIEATERAKIAGTVPPPSTDGV